MKLSKVEIQDKSSKLRQDFAPVVFPEIDGCNFITGDYKGNGGMTGMTVSDNDEWEMFWRSLLKQEPPAPLPPGARAIMMGADYKDDPVAFVPEKIVYENGKNTIHWQRLHLKTEEGPQPRSQFAVLLIPEGNDEQFYRDIFVTEEQRKAAEQFAEDVKVFTEGSREPITLMPITRLKRKFEFTRF